MPRSRLIPALFLALALGACSQDAVPEGTDPGGVGGTRPESAEEPAKEVLEGTGEAPMLNPSPQDTTSRPSPAR